MRIGGEGSGVVGSILISGTATMGCNRITTTSDRHSAM
jgi:hypothetical protein